MAKLNLSRIKARLEQVPKSFAGKEAQMGWFPGARYENGTPVAYVATIQENGAPEAGVPARPFLKPTIEQRQAEWTALLASGVRAVVAGKATAEMVFEGVGLQMVGDVKQQIASNAVAPLSPTTLVLRKWRREGKRISGKTVGQAASAYADDPSIINGVPDDPLQDTGLMITTLNNAVGSPE